VGLLEDVDEAYPHPCSLPTRGRETLWLDDAGRLPSPLWGGIEGGGAASAVGEAHPKGSIHAHDATTICCGGRTNLPVPGSERTFDPSNASLPRRYVAAVVHGSLMPL